MAVGSAVRVGIIVFLAVLLFAGVLYFLRGAYWRGNTYPIYVVYDDVLGLEEGARVTMSGVTIGQVQDVSLDRNQRAVVEMIISKRVRIPEGSRFVVSSGLLVGETIIDIIPNRAENRYLAENARVKGEVPVQFEDLLPQGQKLLANLTEASEDLKTLLSDKEIQGSLKRTAANVERASVSLEKMMATIQRFTTGQQDEIQSIIQNVQVASENVRDMTAELEKFARQGELQENIGATLASARRTVESLERTTTSLEQFVSDPQFQEDIRETVATTRRTVEQAEQALERVSRIFGGGRRIGPRLPTRESNFETLYIPDSGRVRANLTTTLELGESKFLNLGLYDIGVGNKLILQPGRSLSPKTDLRYGLYASRLGLGLDHNFSDKAFGTLNLYDTENPRLDLLTGYKLNDDLDILLGVDKLFDDNQLTLGVRLTR